MKSTAIVRHLPALGALAVAVHAAPEQVSQVHAFFREGQTFLTWDEPAPDAQYRVYRSTQPFTSPHQLAETALVATVHEHSSLNLMASINRLALSRVPAGQEYRMPERKNFVIVPGEAPLGESTGLHVYTAKKDETAYYVVTAVHAGAELRTIGGNCLRTGIAERVEPVGAVAQDDAGDFVHWVDATGTPHYPAMADRPGGAFNFRVHGPRTGAPRALIGVLHGALFQYNTPDAARYAKLDGAEGDRAVRVALDAPLMRGRIEGLDLARFGYGGEARGMPRGWGDATARVLWTLDWVAAHYPVDPDRVSLRGESMGGIGALSIALAQPDRFAAFHAYVPVVGGGSAGTPATRGLARFSAYDAVRQHPDTDFPYILITAGRADHIVGWDDKVEFARFADTERLGFAFYWDAREHAYENVAKYTPVWGEPAGQPTADLSRFSRRQSYPVLSGLSARDDLGTKNSLAVKPTERGPLDAPGMGDLVGTINGQVDWERETIVDEAGRYEITLRLLEFSRRDEATADVTPRRTQQFRPAAGDACRFRVEAAGRVIAEGVVTAGAHGRVTVPQVPLTRPGTRLVIERVR
jgi:dienelactone hydrolase